MKASTMKIFAALMTVYIVWGSTYYAIRLGVESTPPYLFACTRFIAAGLILLGVARAQGLAMPRTKQDWRVIAITGIALLAGANGLVTWSEQWIASNLAALMVATCALWMAVFGLLGSKGERLSTLSWAGLLLGFAGVAVLVGEGLSAHRAPVGAYVALLVAPVLWGAGSIYGRRNPQQCASLVTAAWQMIIAGALMGLIGLALGEAGRWHWTSQTTWAWAYLTVFGSCIAYGAYYWLVHHITPALLGTYAYVNPAIAVLLGWALGGETLSRHEVIGTAIILLSVAAVTLAQRPRKAA